jgi:hypothetical protein
MIAKIATGEIDAPDDDGEDTAAKALRKKGFVARAAR